MVHICISISYLSVSVIYVCLCHICLSMSYLSLSYMFVSVISVCHCHICLPIFINFNKICFLLHRWKSGSATFVNWNLRQVINIKSNLCILLFHWGICVYSCSIEKFVYTLVPLRNLCILLFHWGFFCILLFHWGLCVYYCSIGGFV